MATKQGYIGIPLMPSTYERINFLMSDGNSYIDTGIIPTNNTRIKLDYVQNFLFGALCGYLHKDYTSNNFSIDLKYGGYQANYGASSYSKIVKESVTTDAYSFELNKNLFYINNTLKYTLTSSTFTSPYNVALFAATVSNGGIRYANKGTIIGTVQIYSDDVIVRNFVPCRRISDSVLGMWDIVTQTFYTNDGSGTFLYQNKLLPSTYQELTYIQGDGTAYIKTDYLPTGYSHVTFGVSNYNTNSTNLFGVYATGAIYAFRISSSRYRFSYGSSNGNFPSSLSLTSNYMSIQGNRGTAGYNGNSGVSISAGTFGNTKNYMPIFCMYTVSSKTYSGYSKARIHWMVLSSNTDATVVSKVLIPAKRISDSVLGLYDIVNDTFFTNTASSGSFTAGSNLPGYDISPYVPVPTDSVAQIIRHIYVGDGTAIRVLRGYIGGFDNKAYLWYDRGPQITENDYSWSGTDGTCTLTTSGNNWLMTITGNGTLTMHKNVDVDITLIGGGGGGGDTYAYVDSDHYGAPGGGGGSGYCTFKFDVGFYSDMGYNMVVGAGGAAGAAGKQSSLTYSFNHISTTYTANGGAGGGDANASEAGYGGKGGSGGGAGCGGGGGSNGADGKDTSGTTYVSGSTGGVGSGITTRPFMDSSYNPLAKGGNGGGTGSAVDGTPGTANTGNGGGGGGSKYGTSTQHYGGAGGSGIILIRNAQ